MKELAKEMVNAWCGLLIMDESMLAVAIDNYCLNHNIDLTDDELCEIIDLIMNGEV